MNSLMWEVDELYKEKSKRDHRAKALTKLGYHVRRRAVRNQQLHPMYIEDLKHQVAEEDKGFGNTLYQSRWEVLYGIKAIRK